MDAYLRERGLLIRIKIIYTLTGCASLSNLLVCYFRHCFVVCFEKNYEVCSLMQNEHYARTTTTG